MSCEVRGVETLNERGRGLAFANELWRYVSTGTHWEFNIAKANQILDEAGWKRGPDGIRAKDGKRMKLVFQTSINAPRQKNQAIVKQACQKAGIEFLENTMLVDLITGGTRDRRRVIGAWGFDVDSFEPVVVEARAAVADVVNRGADMIKIALIGCGTVGRGLLEILETKRSYLKSAFGFESRVVAISDLKKGSILVPDGIEIDRLLTLGSGGGGISSDSTGAINFSNNQSIAFNGSPNNRTITFSAWSASSPSPSPLAPPSSAPAASRGAWAMPSSIRITQQPARRPASWR